MVKPKGRGEQRRKSARILALEALKIKKQNEKASTSRQPPPPKQPRRGRKKKRLDQVVVPSAVPTTQQNDEDNPNHQVPPANNVLPSTQQMPERCTLEFILDKLQKRDEHDLFVEPVDMDEVKGYRNVIKHAMDFSTIRAKLQEGMYTSVEQFEGDVFAITSNAMLFNPSSSIYFRQARAIDELARGVFHTLKTEPKRIELEFLQSRRQHGRKPQGDNTTGNSRAHHGSSGAANPHPNEILPPPGNRDGRKVNFCGIGRRGTYNPQTSPSSENDLVISTVCGSKQLVPGNGGIGYKESLMRFVQDLGPSAKNVANWKLRFLTHQPPSYSVRESLAAHERTVDTKGKSVLTADCLDPYNGGIGGKSSFAGRVDFRSGLCRGETIPCSGIMGAHTKAPCRDHMAAADKKNLTPAFNTGGFKFMNLLREAMREDHTPPCNQIPQNQSYSYLPGPGTGIANSPSTWLRDNRGNNYQMQQPAHLGSGSQPGLLAFLCERNRRPKSIVHPTTVIKPSGSGQDLNYGAGSAQMNPPLQWRNPPEPYDFRRIQPQHGGLDQYLQPKPSHVNMAGQGGALAWRPQVATASYMQGQSSGTNAPRQDDFWPQELQFTPTSQRAQPPRRLLNLLGGDLLIQPEPLQLPAVSYAPPPLADQSSPLGQGGAYVQQGPQLPSSQYVQTESKDANSLHAAAYLQQEPEFPPLPCQLNLFQQEPELPPLPCQLNLFSMDLTPPPEGQLGMSDAGSFIEGAPMQRNNINGQFWSFEQQSLRGTQPLDLALQLETQNLNTRRLDLALQLQTQIGKS